MLIFSEISAKQNFFESDLKQRFFLVVNIFGNMGKKRHIQSDLMITLKNDFQRDENKVVIF